MPPRIQEAERVARFWFYVDKNGAIPAHAPDLGPCWCGAPLSGMPLSNSI